MEFTPSNLVLAHVITGLVGIAAGFIVVAGIFLRKRMASANVIFLVMTAAACATGFVFLPTEGVTSAQLVGFFVAFLLVLSAYARYVRRLNAGWNQVFALATVGAVFLNVLITITQSFLHVPALNKLAPMEDSPVYVAVKLILLAVFVVIALAAAARAGRS